MSLHSILYHKIPQRIFFKCYVSKDKTQHNDFAARNLSQLPRNLTHTNKNAKFSTRDRARGEKHLVMEREDPAGRLCDVARATSDVMVLLLIYNEKQPERPSRSVKMGAFCMRFERCITVLFKIAKGELQVLHCKFKIL